jgi:prenyl protein peptidase
MRVSEYDSIKLSTVKNLFIAPLLEEFIYRVCLINLAIESGLCTPTEAVYYMPLYFAIAHVHHAVRDYFLEDKRLVPAIAAAVFKLAYTEVFGIYAGFVYIRTGSLWPILALHSQCNYFGFPAFWNLRESRFRLTDKLIAGVLYLVGVVLVFKLFDTLVEDESPWWTGTKSL